MEIILRMKDHATRWPCSKCGQDAPQVIKQAPMTIIPQHMRFDFDGYESPTSGRHITTKKQRIEDMAQSGCIEYEPGMRQDADRRVIEHDAMLDKLVDETVDREIAAMPARKRENLEAELSRGVAAEIQRL